MEGTDNDIVTFIKQKVDEILVPIKTQLANAKIAATQTSHTLGKFSVYLCHNDYQEFYI